MKLFLLIIASLALVSCSSGLESKAKKQMKETILEMAKNPESVKIDNVKTIINNDSLCVLSFNARGQNSFGGYDRSNYGYYYVKSKKDGKERYMEALQGIEDNKKGILESSEELIYTLADKLNKEPDFSKKSIHNCAYNLASLMCIGSKYGRKIE
jgi:hypothetical protein|nr:MAG TPA: TRAF PROTEIN, TRAO PROTEIN, TRAN ADHESION, BACTERIAL SECRETION.5A [Caudoviricetes sp.]